MKNGKNYSYVRQSPNNVPAFRRRFRRIKRHERHLLNDTYQLIRELLVRCGGRVSYRSQPDEDGCREYPVSMALYGKHDTTLIINITDVYQDGNILRADGIDESGGRRRGFELFPEHYARTRDFLSIALKINRPSKHGKLVSNIKLRIARLLRKLNVRLALFVEFTRLCKAYTRAERCTDYDTVGENVDIRHQYASLEDYLSGRQERQIKL